MAVVVRRNEQLRGQVQAVRVYESVRLVTNFDRAQADRLDQFLAKRMSEIAAVARKQGLLQLKNRPGVLPLWHLVGAELRFLDDPTIVPPEDRKQDRYIWEALWAHAGVLIPGKADRKDAGTDRDHWRMCHRLASFGSLEYVEAVGTWRDWVEFLESPIVNADERILKWVGLKMKGSRKRLLRRLTARLREQFRNRETSGVLTDDELYPELEECWDTALKEAH